MNRLRNVLSFKVIIVIFTLSSFTVMAQPSIIGPTEVYVGEVASFSFSDPSNTYFPGGWESPDGNLLVVENQSTGYLWNMDVMWDSVGTHSVDISYLDSSGSIEDYVTFYINVLYQPAPTPPKPRILSNTNGQVTLAWALGKTPPVDVNWYWQSDPEGEIRNAQNSNNTIVLQNDGTYYLKAYNTQTLDWSDPSSIIFTVAPPPTWYYDSDGDGFGNTAPSISSWTKPTGYVNNSLDYCPGEYGIYDGCPTENDKNYIRSIVYQNPYSESVLNTVSHADKIENIIYFDGLGRERQNIGIRAGGASQDIITHLDYDEYGRKSKDYLPYALESGGGLYRESALTDAQAFYGQTKYESTSNFYSETNLENSPLSRVLEQGAPGQDWAVNKDSDADHTVKFEYTTNKSSDQVKQYAVTFYPSNNPENPNLEILATYSINSLTKLITKDENWTSGTNHTIEEYKDKQGRVVLKRTYADVSGVSTPHDTYYVYDDFGNLTYVLPPKAADVIVQNGLQGSINSSATVTSGNSLNLTASNSIVLTEGFHAKAGSTFTAAIEDNQSSILDKLCYQYKYDNRNRLIEKKIPGKGWEYIVYNKLDQPILTQDANLQSQNKWLFTKYDAFGRVAYTGIFNSSASRATLQNNANGAVLQFESRQATSRSMGGGTAYYSNSAYPNVVNELHTVNYYDSYIDTLGMTVPGTVKGQATSSGTALKGLATVSKVRVLTTSQFITTIIGYDKKGQAVYTKSNNPYLNTVDLVENELDFMGKVKETTTTHTRSSASVSVVTTDNFEYDHAGRLIKQTQTLNGNTEVILENTYDELGQLVNKGVGNTEGNTRLQTVNYTYNIRGWLKGINNTGGNKSAISLGAGDLFGFQINYNDPNSSGMALYNGNISQTLWKTSNSDDSSLKQYNYGYDALNRLTSAVDNTGHYNLGNLNYDKNGNITSLTRTGHMVAQPNPDIPSHWSNMDVLTYNYQANSNKLAEVTDAAINTSGYGEFIDGNKSGDDYSYDDNGNMVKDLNKGIGTTSVNGITYNHLNLPDEVKFDNNNNKRIKYIYDATGVKLSKAVFDNSSTPITTYYAGNYVYEGSSLKFFNHAEGYVDAENGYDYVYQYKDHLGNIRLSYKNVGAFSAPNLEILEENNYYPFGLKHKGYNSNVTSTNIALKRKFGGKEYQDELGLGWYDITARNYDPALGRWFVIDPKADDVVQVDISPYNYGWNNPINVSDPDGECPWCWGAVIGFAVEYGVQVASNLAAGQDLGDALTDVDGGKLLIATATGAATGGLSSVKVIGATAKVYKAVAVSSTAAGGNIVKQAIVDGNKMLDPIEMATDALLENVPIPKVEVPNVSKGTIKTAEKQLDRAERVAGENPRPSREQAVKDSKEKVETLKNKEENINNVNKVGNEVKDAVVKEASKSGLEKSFEENEFKKKL